MSESTNEAAKYGGTVPVSNEVLDRMEEHATITTPAELRLNPGAEVMVGGWRGPRQMAVIETTEVRRGHGAEWSVSLRAIPAGKTAADVLAEHQRETAAREAKEAREAADLDRFRRELAEAAAGNPVAGEILTTHAEREGTDGPECSDCLASFWSDYSGGSDDWPCEPVLVVARMLGVTLPLDAR